MTHQGELIGIAIRSESRGPMNEREQATITVEHGVDDDFRGKPGARQVTVLAQEDWDAACGDLGKPLPWTTRRANLFVKGIALPKHQGGEIATGLAVTVTSKNRS